MWLYVAIVAFVLFALYKERQALGCPSIPNGSDCDNANGKAVVGTKPSIDDSNDEILDKIDLAGGFADRDVAWRKSVIVAFISTFILFFLLHRRIPTAVELFIGIFSISPVIYFMSNFYKYHLINYITKNIHESTALLRSRM